MGANRFNSNKIQKLIEYEKKHLKNINKHPQSKRARLEDINKNLSSLFEWENNKKQKLQKQQELIKDKEMQHCTFKPNINSIFQFKENPTSDDIPNKNIQERTLERMQYWEDKKITKLELQKNVSRNKDIENCSFKPITNSSLPDFQGKYIKGLKNYLNRQIKSQQVQKEKKDKLNPNYNEMYDNLFKKREKRIAEQNMNYKDYQNAMTILHKELHKN